MPTGNFATDVLGIDLSKTGQEASYLQEVQNIAQPTIDPTQKPEYEQWGLQSQEEMDLMKYVKDTGGSSEDFTEVLQDFRLKTEPTFPEKVGGEVEEEISGLDVGVKTGEAISGAGEFFKFESNVDDGIIESGAKFLSNLPGNAVQLAGDLITVASDPVGTTKSMLDLAQGLSDKFVFSTLNTVFGQEVDDTEKAVMVEAIGGELKKIATTPGEIKAMLVENPADVLLAITGGLGIAKNVAKTKGLTKLATGLEKAEAITNPINVLQKEAQLVKETGKLSKAIVTAPFKITPKIIRKITPEKIGNAIAGIDNDTANVLKRTSKNKLDEILNQAQSSIDDVGNVPSPFAKAGTKAEEALDLLRVQKRTAGATKGDALKGISGKEVDITPIVDKFDDLLSDRFNLKVTDEGKLVGVGGKIPKSADELQSFADALNELRTTPNSKISLQNLDSLVDNLQATFRKAKIDRPGANLTTAEKTIEGFVEGTINRTLKETAGVGFQNANTEFKNIADLVTDFEKILGPKANKVEGLMKGVFSPQTGERTSKIFRAIRENTGIDLIEESKLAKFGMEAVGDTRAFNLLNALDLGPGFASGKAALLQKALQTIFSPEKTGRALTK